MRDNGKAAASATTASGEGCAWTLRDCVILSVGYGCFLTYFPIGPIGTAFLTQVATGWQSILLTRMLFLIATVVVIVLFKARSVYDLLHSGRMADATFLVALASFAVFLAAETSASPDWLACIFAILLGAATAVPKLGWYEAFFLLHQARGRGACIAVIAGCYFVASLFTPLTWVMGASKLGLMATVTAIVALSWGCFRWTARSTSGFSAERPASASAKPAVHTEYRASTYVAAMMVGFGISWSFSYNLAALLGYGSGPAHATTWSVMAAGIVVSAVLVVAASRARLLRSVGFSMLLRWCVVFVGVIWAFTPVITQGSTPLACFMVSTAYILQNVVMILFIMEVCGEHEVTVCSVTGTQYGIFVMAAGVGTGLFWAFSLFLEETTAHMLMEGVCVAGCLAVIPFLPSRNSSAGTFTLDVLPEDKCYEERFERSKQDLAATWGLSARESEVLDLLVTGATRADIATHLSVSPWTVKNHVSNIYSKSGTHSRRELTALVASGAEVRW